MPTTKQVVGTLLVVILATAFYISMQGVKVRLDDDKTTFYVRNDNNRWVVSGREYNKIFDGSSQMNRDVSGITRTIDIDDVNEKVLLTRVTPYIRGPIIIDTYLFDGTDDDKRRFPIEHNVTILNGQGYFYRYEVRDLVYSGTTYKIKDPSIALLFGRHMEVELDESSRFRWGWVYASGIVKAQYDIPSDFEIYHVRLFDPVTPPDCIMDANYTQTADVNCHNVSANGFTWQSDGWALNVSGDVNITDQGTDIDALINTTNITSARGINNVTFGSLTIDATGTYIATAGTTTITKAGTCYNNSGTFTDNTGLVTFSGGCTIDTGGTGATQDFDDISFTGGTSILVGNNLDVNDDATINGGDFNASSQTVTLGDDFTITSGTYHASSGTTTVGGTTSVTGTFNSTSGTLSLGSGKTDDWGLQMVSGGTFIGGSGTHTMGSIGAVNAGLTLTLTSGTTTIDSEHTGDNFALEVFNNNAFNDANGEVVFTYAGATKAYLGSVEKLYDVTLNHASLDLELAANIVMDNDLTVIAGTLDVGGRTLTVTGDVNVTGTLEGDTLDHSFGSLTINSGGTYSATSGTTTITKAGNCYNNSGTFTDNAGKVDFSPDTGGCIIDTGGTGTSNDFRNLTFSGTNSTLVGNNLDVDDKLVINGGNLTAGGKTITVAGDVTVAAGEGLFGGSGAMSFGSLVLAANSLYSATSGTTTITSEDSGHNAFTTATGSIFTHNSGTVSLEMSGAGSYSWVNLQGTGGFYDLVHNSATKSAVTYAITVANDLTVTSGEFEANSPLTVTEDVDVTGTLDGDDGGDAMSFGTLTINGAGTYEATGGTTTITSTVFDNDGTFTANGGLVLLDWVGTTTFDGVGGSAGNLYDLEISGGTVNIGAAGTVIDNDLTVTLGTFKSPVNAYTFTVTGDVDVTGTFGSGTRTGANNFGSLTINSGGTYLATSGTTTISGDINIDGTFTHNDGVVLLDTASNVINVYANNAVFYNLTHPTGGGAYAVRIEESYKVLNSLDITKTITSDTITATFGNSTHSGRMIGSGDYELQGGKTVSLYAANQLYPVIIDGDRIDWDQSAGTWKLKWIDYQSDTTIGSSNVVTVQLDGDCEFDAFTVSAGDTFTLNGQTGTFSGVITPTGTFNGSGGNLNLTGSTSTFTQALNLTDTYTKSGASLIMSESNLSTATATIDGTLNLTAGSSLIFEDTAGAGFGTSAGTLNIMGVSGNLASLMSATEPGPTNTPTINATLLTVTCDHGKIYTVDSTDATITCWYSEDVSSVGAWIFLPSEDYTGLETWLDTWLDSTLDAFLDLGQFLWGGDGITG